MANVKVTALAEATSISADDLIMIIDDPSGSEANKKATFTNVVASVPEATTSVKGLMSAEDKAIADGTSTHFDSADSYKLKGTGIKTDAILPNKLHGSIPLFAALRKSSLQSGEYDETEIVRIIGRTEYDYTRQTIAEWQDIGYISFATIVTAKIIDRIGIFIGSNDPITDDLYVRMWLNNELIYDKTIDSADLPAQPPANAVAAELRLDLDYPLPLNVGDVLCVGYATTGTNTLSFYGKSASVDATKDLGLNQRIVLTDATQLTGITVPPAQPSSDTTYLPFHGYEVKAENAKFETNLIKSAMYSQSGETEFNEIAKIAPVAGHIWSANATYTKKGIRVWYKGVTEKIVDRISIPIVRDLYTNDVFTDGIYAAIYIGGVLIKEVTITIEELAPYNLLTTSSAKADFFYDIDLDYPVRINADDIIFIGWECLASADLAGILFTGNASVGDTSEWTRNYLALSNTAGFVTDIATVPTVPSSTTFYIPINFSYKDYIAKKIENGGVTPVTLANIAPEKIYSVCNDIITSSSGFISRNYAACLYLDHLLNLTTHYPVKFLSTDSDKLPVFAPVAEDNDPYNSGNDVNTATITETIRGTGINDISVSFSHISTKASVTSAGFPKILCITDSTGEFLADIPYSLTTDKPASFWSYIKKFFELDKIDAGSGHDCLMVGKRNSREFMIGENTYKTYAECRGGWTTRNYLYDASVSGADNYFYDGSKAGTVKFSLAKYLSNYKTLADDGVTRLAVGSTAGALVTDVNTADVCTPTHVVIQLGFNDVEANFIADLTLLVNDIKTEFPNMIVIISIVDAAGTFFPEKYPMFDATSVNMVGDALHSKMYNLVTAAMALENVEENIFFCPNFFIQPTAWGVAYRDIDFPESLANPDFILKTAHGAGNNYHPNTIAHAAWGYQLYSLIKYTLTL